MNGCMDVCLHGWMDVWMYACMDTWMDAWMHGCIVYMKLLMGVAYEVNELLLACACVHMVTFDL